MSFNFASLSYRSQSGQTESPKPAWESFPECIGTRLDADSVLELWQERSAIQETDNTDLIHWHHDNERSEAELRRACELCVAADMSLQHGRYVESIIRPHLANERD